MCNKTIANQILPKPKNKPTTTETSKNQERMQDLPNKPSGYKRFAKSDHNIV